MVSLEKYFANRTGKYKKFSLTFLITCSLTMMISIFFSTLVYAISSVFFCTFIFMCNYYDTKQKKKQYARLYDPYEKVLDDIRTRFASIWIREQFEAGSINMGEIGDLSELANLHYSRKTPIQHLADMWNDLDQDAQEKFEADLHKEDLTELESHLHKIRGTIISEKVGII